MSEDGCVRCGFIGSHTCITSANGSVRITAMTPSGPLTGTQANRIATLERELAAAWWAAWGAIWPVVGHGMEVWEYDGHWERELAAVTAERDALLAGTRAGPWEHEPERPWGAATWEGWVRRGPFSASVSVVRRPDPIEPVSVWGMAPGLSRAFASVNEAKAACDAALLAAGWYLAATPPTGTPGDGTR